MDVTPEQAVKSLQEIEEVSERTQTTVAYAGTDLIIFLWGLIWVSGFLLTHVSWEMLPALSKYVGVLWLVLIAIGFLGSFLLYRRYTPTRNPGDKRIGWLWFCVYFYSWVLLSILWPVLNFDKYPEVFVSKMYGALNSIAPAFAYILMGLYLRNNSLSWIGAYIIVITWFGFFFFNPFFGLWMAILGGGMFVAAGIYMRLQVRKAGAATAEQETEHA